MTRNVILAILLLVSVSAVAQVQTNIIGDSVKIKSNTGTGELILENSTKNVNGFLYNKGNGRTEFRKGLLRINDSVYVIGGDTLNLYAYTPNNAWKTRGNLGTNKDTNFVGTIDSMGFVVRTNNKQRISVWANGTVNIGPSDGTSNPIFRFYPNGDLSAGANNDYTYNQFTRKNGIRYNRKLGLFEIGVSNNIDTSISMPNDSTHYSALVVNSGTPNTITGPVNTSVISGSNLNISGTVGNSFIAGSTISINGFVYAAPVIGENIQVIGNVSKSFINGYGHRIYAADCRESFINGTSNYVYYKANSNLINGYVNSDLDSSYSNLVTGSYNTYSGNSQLIAGIKLVSKGFGSTTLGSANVDFASLAPVKNAQPSNLKSYPLLAIGNSGNFNTIRSNAFTMLYNGRTQINTTGYDSTLAETNVTPKAALEVVSTNSGVLLPKLTTAQRNAIVSGDKHNGLLLYNTDSTRFQYYDGSTWKNVGDNSSSSGNLYAIQTLSDAGTITWNAANGNNSTLILGGSGRTLSITNPVAGQTYRIKIKQDNVGSRTITTWPTGVLWPSGEAPTLSVDTGAIDLVTFYYDGVNFYGDYKLFYKPIGDVKIINIDAKAGLEETTHTLTNVPAGALLVVTTAAESSTANSTISSNPVLTWAKKADATAANSGDAEIYTATFVAGGSITINPSWGADDHMSSVCYTIINQEPVLGGNVVTAVAQATPVATINTTRTNSLIVGVSSDFAGRDGAGRTYSGSPVETKYQYDVSEGTYYHYYKQATAVTGYALGLTSPLSQEAGMALLEIRGKTSLGYDTDAQRYFDSVATTGSLTLTEKNAWNNFVLAAKSGTNYWGNIAVINPVLGATSAEHAWNAKNPATFKATYSGTITHTANHMVSNGTTGYVNSHFNMSTNDGDGLATIAVWVRNNVDATAVAMGAISATNRYTQIYPRFGNTFYGQVNTNNSISEAVTVSTSAGLSLATRLTSTGIYLQRNATQTGGTTSSQVTNNDIYVLAQNSNGSAAFFSTYQVCMYMIATTPFTTAQASQFYTDFSTFINAVGR